MATYGHEGGYWMNDDQRGWHHPPPTLPAQADVDALRGLLDLMANFSSNDQRARYLLTCNWMRDRQQRGDAWKQVALGVRDQYGKAVELLGEAGGTLAGVAKNGAGKFVTKKLCDILDNLAQRISACMSQAHVDTPGILKDELQADYNPVADVSELSACPQTTATGDGDVHARDSTCRESAPAAAVSGDQEHSASRERTCPPRDVGPNAEPR